MDQSLKTTRNQYLELFGAEKVEWACRKANWHKARALKWNLDLHFSAWQWLDLCAGQAWQCAYCYQNLALEPHHRHELCKGGFNTIENLDAICKTCHERVHEWPDDVSQAWMTFQGALMERFRRVALASGAVRLACGTREENQSRCRGVLLEFHAPKQGRVPLRGILPHGDWKAVEPLVVINTLNREWWDNRAAVQVQWHAGGMWEEKVVLSHLAPVETDIDKVIPRQRLPREGAEKPAALQFALAF